MSDEALKEKEIVLLVYKTHGAFVWKDVCEKAVMDEDISDFICTNSHETAADEIPQAILDIINERARLVHNFNENVRWEV